MAVDRSQANLQKLKEADEIQEKTKAAVTRIQRQVAATEEMAITSLEELRKQGQQMDEINRDLTDLSSKLDQSQALQNRFDSWAGNWLGGKKRAAIKEAKQELASRSDEGLSVIKEVYENEKYDSFSRSWKPAGMTLASNPTVSAPEVFDPAVQEKSPESVWLIDYSLSGVDPEGWTYAKDFNYLNNKGVGESSPKWSCYVRRRKWRYHDKRSHGGDALSEVRDRNLTRSTAKPQGALGQVERIGYIPRNKVPVLQATGYQSSHMKGRKDSDELDAESRDGLARIQERDAEIDHSLGQVLNIVDNLDQIANAMNDEVRQQEFKTRALESNLSIAEEKQAIVNARQKKLLKTS